MGCSQSTQVIENKRIQNVQKLQKFNQQKSIIREIPERGECFLIGVIEQNEPLFANVKLQSLSINKMSIPVGFTCYNFSSILQITNDRYLITGGITQDLTNISNQAYIYYLTQHKVQKLLKMSQARYTHISIFYQNQIYVIGGRYYGNDQQAILKNCQKYNLQKKQWIKLPELNIPRCTSFAFIWNKLIYVFGGYTGPYQRSTKIEFLNEKQQRWQLIQVQLNRGLQGAILIPTNHNQVTIFGGLCNSGPTDSVTSLNIKNKTIQSRKKLLQKRSLGKGFYKNGNIYIFGGDQNFTCQIYEIQSKNSKIIQKQFSIQIADFDNLGYSTASVVVPYNQSQSKLFQQEYEDQIVYIFGSTQEPFICQLNISIPYANIFPIPLTMKLYAYQGGLALNKNQFILFGGIEDDSLSVITGETYLLNIKTKNSIKLAKMNQNRYAFAYQKQLSQKKDQKDKGQVEYIYCFGGATSNKQGKLVFLSTCQRYSIKKNKWQLISPLPEKLISPMSLIYNKNIFVFGGTNQKDIKSRDIFVYDKVLNNWNKLQYKLPFGLQAGSIIKKLNPNSNQLSEYLIFGGRTQNGQIPNIWSFILNTKNEKKKQKNQQLNIQNIICSFQELGQMNQAKSLHKIYKPKHQQFYVILGGQKYNLSCYKKKDLTQQTSDLIYNMKEMFTNTISYLNSPDLKEYLIITPDEE